MYHQSHLYHQNLMFPHYHYCHYFRLNQMYQQNLLSRMTQNFLKFHLSHHYHYYHYYYHYHHHYYYYHCSRNR